jgi:hypothetical protein
MIRIVLPRIRISANNSNVNRKAQRVHRDGTKDWFAYKRLLHSKIKTSLVPRTLCVECGGSPAPPSDSFKRVLLLYRID